MISTRPPRYHGEETKLAHGDELRIDRERGLVSFHRNGEQLMLNAYPFDPDLPQDAVKLSIEFASRLTVADASAFAKIFGIASGLKVKCAEEDGVTSRFTLFDPEHRPLTDAHS